MAGTMLGMANMDFVNSLKAVPGGGGQSSLLGTAADYVSINALRSALFTYDPITYDTSTLNIMTVNDMTFALRSCKDPKTIADYVTAQVVHP